MVRRAHIAIHYGTLESGDLAGCESVSKVCGLTLAAGGLKLYPSLSVEQGVFSLRDGSADAFKVDGTLALKGGATLAVDFGAAGCDRISATSLDLVGATEENPFVIDAKSLGEVSLEKPLAIIEGAVRKEDMRKFRLVCDKPAKLVLRSGSLALGDVNASVFQGYTILVR